MWNLKLLKKSRYFLKLAWLPSNFFGTPSLGRAVRQPKKSPGTQANFRKWREAGFSLLEVLIAVGILAVAATTLITAQGSSFLAVERSQKLMVATDLARQKMAEIEIAIEQDLQKNKFPDEEKSEAGKFEKPFEDYRWKMTIKKVEIPMVAPDDAEGAANSTLVQTYAKNVMDQISQSVRELQLTVFWGDSDLKEEDQPNLVVTTHIVKPN